MERIISLCQSYAIVIHLSNRPYTIRHAQGLLRLAHRAQRAGKQACTVQYKTYDQPISAKHAAKIVHFFEICKFWGDKSFVKVVFARYSPHVNAGKKQRKCN